MMKSNILKQFVKNSKINNKTLLLWFVDYSVHSDSHIIVYKGPLHFKYMMKYADQKRHAVPRSGTWYLDADRMAEGYKCDTDQFMTAWDSKQDVQCYGLYPNASAFVHNLVDCDLDNRRAYEIIHPDKPCNAYADALFNDPLEMPMFLACVTQKAKAEYGTEPIFEMIGLSKDNKHLLRLVIPNLPFFNNHDGRMRRFFEGTPAIINNAAYVPMHTREIGLYSKQGQFTPINMTPEDMENPLYILKTMASHVVMPVSTTPMVTLGYKFGEYCVNHSQLPSNGTDMLNNVYSTFVLSNFNHSPIALSSAQIQDISTHVDAAQKKFAVAGLPKVTKRNNPDRLDLIIHTIYEIDPSSINMYSMLAALALVLHDHPSFTVEVGYATMTACMPDESAVAMVYSVLCTFMEYASTASLHMEGDPIQVLLAMLKPDNTDIMFHNDRIRHEVPSGGVWFQYDRRVAEAQAKNPSRFMISWDKKNGAKCFGLYATNLIFTINLMKCDKNKRWAYEIIPTNTPCKAFGDIEFYGPADPLYPNGWHRKMDMTLAHLDQQVFDIKKYHGKFEVLHSSRPEEGTIKHSFHVIIENLIFPNCHDGTMAAFFNVPESFGDEWFDVHNDIRKPIIDQTVYTKKRNLRTVSSSKYAKVIPLRPLSPNFRLMEFDDNQDPQYLLKFLVSNPDPQYSIVDSIPQIQRKVSKRNPRSATSKPEQREWTSDMFRKKDLEDILRRNGDTVSRVTKIDKHYDHDDQYWVQCDQRKQKRRCIINPDLVHDSNNCRLRVTLQPRHGYSVEYSCTSASCKNPRYQLLGYILNYSESVQAHNPTKEPSFDIMEIPIDHLTKQLNLWVGGINEKNSTHVRDLLIEIAYVHGKDNTDVQTACVSAYRLNCTWDEQILKNSWDQHQISNVHQCTCDPLDELQRIYTQDTLFNVNGCMPHDDTQDLLVDEKYCLPYMRKIPTNPRVTVLKAQCGMGKTNAMHQYIRDIPKIDVCLFIVSRTAVGIDTEQRLPVIGGIPNRVASTISGDIDLLKYPRLIIQLETLQRVRLESCRDLNIVVIMDETLSIFRQIESKFGDQAMIQYNLRYLLTEANHVLAMDGYFDQDRLDVLNRYTKSNAHVVHNTFMRKLDLQHEVMFTDKLQNTIDYTGSLLASGVRFQVCCFSKIFAEQLERIYKLKYGDTKKIGLYTSDNRFNPADNANEVLGALDVFIHTATMDIGINLLLEQFKECIMFVDLNIPLSCDVAAQMTARNRAAVKYLVYIGKSRFPQCDCDVQAVIDEMDVKTVNTANMLYMGIDTVRMDRSDTRDACSPLLLNIATNESVLRRSRNDFKLALSTLFIREGARVSIWNPGKLPSLEVETKEAKKFVKQIPTSTLLDAYGDIASDVFEDMADKDRKLYATRKNINAYKLQTLLRSEGPNLEASVFRMKAKVAIATAAADACLNSGRFDVNDVNMVQLHTGVRGGNLKINVADMVMCVFEFFTGIKDPFLFTSQYQSVMQRRLGITSDAEGVSVEQTAQLFSMWHRFVALDPYAHMPSYPIKEVPRIAFKQAMTILNHILYLTLTVKLIRDGTSIGSRNTGIDYRYIVLKNTMFSEQNQDIKKPMLIQWNQSPPALREEDVFMVKTVAGRQLLTLNESFIQFRDHSDEFRPRGYTAITREHLDPDDVLIDRAKNRLCELLPIMKFIVAECPVCKWSEHFRSNGHSIQKSQSDECLLVDIDGTTSCLVDVVLTTQLQYSDNADIVRFTVGDIMQSTTGRLNNMCVFQISDCSKCHEQRLHHDVDRVTEPVHASSKTKKKRALEDIRPEEWWRDRKFDSDGIVATHQLPDQRMFENIRFRGNIPKYNLHRTKQRVRQDGETRTRKKTKRTIPTAEEIIERRAISNEHLKNIERTQTNNFIFQIPAICRRGTALLSSTQELLVQEEDVHRLRDNGTQVERHPRMHPEYFVFGSGSSNTQRD